MHVADELTDDAGFCRSAPDNSLVGISHQRLHGNDFQPGKDVFGYDLLIIAHIQQILDTQHAGDTGTVQVHVQQSGRKPLTGKRHGQVGGKTGFAHPTLAAHDDEFVVDIRQCVDDALVLGIGGLFITAGVSFVGGCVVAHDFVLSSM